MARDLVDSGLAACVNRLPGIRSVYRWQGAVHDDAEELLIVKTSRERVDAVVARVREIHPYEVPEVIALPVEAGSAPYLAWVLEQTAGSG
ncbi:MAG TPA: divalent-cation tolerance protein CutA [Myxococcota bacterium]|nr:divalent-cation tolerance protein CutA [Myxococcota bacterium]